MHKELKKELHKDYTYHFFFNDGLLEEITHLQDFINSTDEFLKSKLFIENQHHKDFENNHPSFTTENQFENIFPNILWRTTFLHSYFLLESSLNQICKNIQELEEHPVSLKDISGAGIQRACTYLRKVCNIDIPFETDSWKEIQDFNKVRNIFVHSDGEVEKSNQEIVKIASKYNGLNIDDFGNYGFAYLGITKEFVIYALESIDRFFHDLHVNIRPKQKGIS
jgi:hypothetical protein